jgi:hypothetical protein
MPQRRSLPALVTLCLAACQPKPMPANIDLPAPVERADAACDRSPV